MESIAASKKKVIRIALALAAAEGLLNVLLAPALSSLDANDARGGLLRIIEAFLITAVIMAWFVLDAKEHDYRLTKAQFIFLFAMTALAAPIYFFRSRGRQGWKAIWKGFLFLVCLALTSGIGSVIGLLVLYLMGHDVNAIMDQM